ncbi:hypothetical protein [Streptomyces virginiae]|uniref:hypothetical protein n=1 Tax=Streptomyces virginiae TaxID=1961 RepID=UPI00224CFD10|nr:hypothetical protein [Streptomyces virginiae]MCX5278052.1 hypothetical protein [Streptomyces virginiae]
MSLAIAAAPSPAHDIARWLLDRLGTEFWELDGLLNLAILRNYEGHEILLDVADGQLTLTAQVNLADDDDVPLVSIREARRAPADPDDPILFELLDVIRHRLAPAYGRQNVSQAVAVLTTPLLEGRAGTVRITEHDRDRSATITIGHGENCRELFVTGGPTGTAPTVALLLRSLPLPTAQEIVRQALKADGHDIPVPLTATPDTLRDMITRARGEEPPRPTEQTGPRSTTVYTAPGLAVQLPTGDAEPRATVWVERVSVETATTMLYACTRKN